MSQDRTRPEDEEKLIGCLLWHKDTPETKYCIFGLDTYNLYVFFYNEDGDVNNLCYGILTYEEYVLDEWFIDRF